ncbi:MAG: DUF4200 domain-containing protein [Bacteroidia bacterium]|nr:DUF4200 domain-containing protein [Bacteroidia bacterium]
MKKRIIIFGIFMALTAIGMSQTVWNGSNTTGNAYRSGNVGIGTTTSPTKALEIKTATANDGILITQTSSGHSTFRLDNTSTAGHKYGFCSSGNGSQEGSGHFILYDYTDNRYNLFISGGGFGQPTAGFMGIGTIAPTAKLDIRSTDVTPFSISDGSGGTYEYRLKQSSGNVGSWILNNSKSYGFGEDNSGVGHIWSNVNQSYKLINFKSIGTNLDIAQVWIGNTTPNSPHNDFMFAVAGKMVAQSCYITASTAWADYVFAPEYKLKSLENLEDYIKENKHLPNIPSAKEIEANGINMGEMSKIQMEKIEELTLYIIELKKEIEAIKKEIKN